MSPKKKKNQVQSAADALAYEAWTRWVEEEENVVDDVTCIIVWLNSDDSTSPAKVRSEKTTKRKAASVSRPTATAGSTTPKTEKP